MELASVDLFCGAGGLTVGLENAGIPVYAGIDADPDCRYPYEENTSAEFIEADVSNIDSDVVNKLFPEDSERVLVGCAPCQPFSTLKNGEDTEGTDEWELLESFERIVFDIEPEYVVMENVVGIRDTEIFTNFVHLLYSLGYNYEVEDVYCPDYGIPQKRKRTVLIASTLGDVELPEPTHSKDDHPTVRDAIGGEKLPEIDAGNSHEDDRLHRSRTLSETNLERIKQSTPGGTWKDWDEELILDCHKKESGETFGSVYGRMEWDEPAPTITTQFHNYGSGRFGHPEQNRAISLREGAILQTFPEDYSFVPEDAEIEFEKISPMIGNAVPVRLAEVVGEKIIEHYQGKKDVKSKRVKN
jgi:DNA (cytosine-5)-methyltransferase 1